MVKLHIKNYSKCVTQIIVYSDRPLCTTYCTLEGDRPLVLKPYEVLTKVDNAISSYEPPSLQNVERIFSKTSPDIWESTHMKEN